MSDSTASPVTEPLSDQDYRARIGLAARPEVVFEALTTLPKLAAWWSAVTGDGHTDGELRFHFAGDSPLILHVDATRPHSLVQWTCMEYAPMPEWAGTTISFELAPGSAGRCDLSFRHRGLTPRLTCYPDCRNGWDHFLASLGDFVATGQGNPWGSDADIERREARRAGRASLT